MLKGPITNLQETLNSSQSSSRTVEQQTINNTKNNDTSKK